jgi:hypothetical protein
MTTLCILAYIGPGGALSAVGSFLALLAAVVLGVLGFVWYPIKRMLRARRERNSAGAAATPGDGPSVNAVDPS